MYRATVPDKLRVSPTPARRGAAGSDRSGARTPSVSEPQRAGWPIRVVRIFLIDPTTSFPLFFPLVFHILFYKLYK